ncbi:MAG: electron transfer flavoprotein subunit alpha/FixB family protein, partial [Acidobacteria bacterium]|nr:electron transfer flavoprotein subunit alpha/FixB family protein [Acidobacteriota bacterium]
MILVVAEQLNGALNRVSWEVIAAAQQAGGPVRVAVLGAEVGALAAELAAADVEAVLQVQAPALGAYTLDGYVTALTALVAAEKPEHVWLPHTYQTRDFAPALAVRAGRALVTDCVGTKTVDGRRLFVRPVFQGRLLADVETAVPAVTTFQIGAVRADSVIRGAAAAPVRILAAAVDGAAIRQKPDAPFREAKQAVDLSQAERIVAVGRGIKAQEKVALAQELAAALGAEVGASRPICDAGWLPMDRQIGSSGQTVAPKVYVALGISGAIQHLVGM